MSIVAKRSPIPATAELLLIMCDFACFHSYYHFTARRNARIASAVLAIAILLVCPSVCLSVLSVWLSHAGIVSKRLHVPKNVPEGRPRPVKFWLKLTYPLQKAVSFDTFCLVAPER